MHLSEMEMGGALQTMLKTILNDESPPSLLVIPVKTGIQNNEKVFYNLDSRLRGNDTKYGGMTPNAGE